MANEISKPLLQLGDRVRIRFGNGMRGRIVELRGPLAPGGGQVYRVRISRRIRPTVIDFREDQLILLPPKT